MLDMEILRGLVCRTISMNTALVCAIVYVQVLEGMKFNGTR
jgi:hypothetical protein